MTKAQNTMPVWLSGLGLALLVSVGQSAAVAATPVAQGEVAEAATPQLEPSLKRESIQKAAIDTEDFEVGLYAGVLSIQDFGVNAVYGARFAYHISEDFFAEAVYGFSQAGTTSYERLSGAARLLTDSERQYRYYNVALGYNFLPGEAFVGQRYAFTTAFYLILGAGSTNFGGDDRFTIDVGTGYRLLLNDWLAFHVNVRDHLFNSDVLGVDETTHNIELHTGLTVFF